VPGQPLHDGARELQQPRAAARLGARRQRLDGLLGPLRAGDSALLRSDRAARARAHALRLDEPEPRQEDADADPRVGRGRAYALYSENVRWKVGPVVYLGLNVQGSNDNFPYHDTDAENPTAPVRSDAEIDRERAEEVARKAADIHWLQEGFAYAKQVGAKGVLIDWQADPTQQRAAPHEPA
jgi:hypothetical protein